MRNPISLLLALFLSNTVAAASTACASHSRAVSSSHHHASRPVSTASSTASSRSIRSSSSKPSRSKAASSVSSSGKAVSSTRTVSRSVSASMSGTSSRQSASSSQSAGSDVISISGCPPITLTTTTQSQVEIISVNSDVVTSYVPLRSDTTITITTTTDLTVVQGPPVTSSLAGSVTVTSISIVPASTTITQPTAAGFTPILCEAEYYNPTVTTNYSTSTDTAPSTSLIFTSDPAAEVTFTNIVSEYTSTTTISQTDTFTLPTFATVTATSIRDDPTSTVYAACASSNVSPDFPTGGYVYGVEPYNIDPSNQDPNSYGVPVTALDSVDCCAQCQANSMCVASAYDVRLTSLQCQLFFKSPSRNQTCDARYLGADVYSFIGTPYVYISNSACGQYKIRIGAGS